MRNKKVINASEIGQFHFCNIAWYLQRKGCKPISPNLEIGKKKHIDHGRIVEKTSLIDKISKTFIYIGIVFIILAIFYYFFEVFL